MKDPELARLLVPREGSLVPKERYTAPEFLELEMERLWPRVWQVACREEEIPATGDYLEYVIGDQSILIVRVSPSEVKGYFNTCLHRGTRLAEGTGSFGSGEICCRYHAWRYSLDGYVRQVVDDHEFGPLPEGLRLREVRAERWGGFVFVNMSPDAEPLLEYLEPLPSLLAPYHLEHMRFHSYRSTILPANWKVAVDAFNEGYHVQGTHPQLLHWTDDVSIQYEQLGIHSHYGRLPKARRELRPSPRLGIAPEDVDEGAILASLVAGLGGLFYKEEQELVEEVRKSDEPGPLLERYQKKRMQMLASRGLDVSGLTPDQMTSADDFYWFPNLVGPIYPGSAILFRVRPNGLDPDSAIHDIWTLEWPRPGTRPVPPKRKFYADWTDRDWGLITNQDFANMEHVQAGMKSRGCEGLRLNPRQESNILHMHRMIDHYLTSA